MRKFGFAAQVIAAVGVIYLAGSNSPSTTQAQGQGQADGPEFVQGEVLVQYRAGTSEDDKVRARGRAGAELNETVLEARARRDGKGDLELARIPPGLSIAAAARNLESDPAVEFAEPNWIYQHQATSNDTYYSSNQLWGMYGDSDDAGQSVRQPGRRGVGRGTRSGQRRSTSASSTRASSTPTPTSPPTSGPTRTIRSTASTTTATATSTTSTAGTSRQRQHDLRRRIAGELDNHGTHVAGTIGARGGNGGRRRRRQLERHDDLRPSSSAAAAARPPTPSRRSTTSPT